MCTGPRRTRSQHSPVPQNALVGTHAILASALTHGGANATAARHVAVDPGVRRDDTAGVAPGASEQSEQCPETKARSRGGERSEADPSSHTRARVSRATRGAPRGQERSDWGAQSSRSRGGERSEADRSSHPRGRVSRPTRGAPLGGAGAKRRGGLTTSRIACSCRTAPHRTGTRGSGHAGSSRSPRRPSSSSGSCRTVRRTRPSRP